jgi:hypothetical protein
MNLSWLKITLRCIATVLMVRRCYNLPKWRLVVPERNADIKRHVSDSPYFDLQQQRHISCRGGRVPFRPKPYRSDQEKCETWEI